MLISYALVAQTHSEEANERNSELFDGYKIIEKFANFLKISDKSMELLTKRSNYHFWNVQQRYGNMRV